MLRRVLAIVLIALTVSACSSSRSVVSSRHDMATYRTERAEKVVDSVVVAERDTILETTTIHIQTNEVGDTIARSMVTDRTRARSRDAITAQKTKTEVVRDTVFVEKRDSIEIRSRPEGAKDGWGNQLARVLRLVLWIVIGLIGLVIVVRIKR